MSIATQISRILGLRNDIRDKLIALGLLSSSSSGGSVSSDRTSEEASESSESSGTDSSSTSTHDLEDCRDAILAISGTRYITDTRGFDVAGYQYAQISDANLTASNIANGVTVLGITGTHSGSTPSQTVVQGRYTYGQSAAPEIIYPSSGEVFGSVVPVLASSPTLVASNVKNGVTIMGVSGTYETPTQTNAMELGSSSPATVYPDSGYTLSSVSPRIDTSIIKASNIKGGVSILGITGTYGSSTTGGSATPLSSTVISKDLGAGINYISLCLWLPVLDFSSISYSNPIIVGLYLAGNSYVMGYASSNGTNSSTSFVTGIVDNNHIFHTTISGNILTITLDSSNIRFMAGGDYRIKTIY